MKYEEVKQQLSESSLSRVWLKIQNHTCGAITGYRGENSQENNQILVNYLQGKGYSITRVDGSYIENFNTPFAREVKEPTFFVCNHMVKGSDNNQLENHLRKLGAIFDQDSVLIVPPGGTDAYLVGTSQRTTAWPSFGQKVVVGQANGGMQWDRFFHVFRDENLHLKKFKHRKLEMHDGHSTFWSSKLMRAQRHEAGRVDHIQPRCVVIAHRQLGTSR